MFTLMCCVDRQLSSANTVPSALFIAEPTLEEDEFPVVPLVGSVDVGGQTLPEVADGHGVAGQHLVVANAPQPLVL